MKRIEVLAGRTQKDVLDEQCDVCEDRFDSIKEAKAHVKRIMSRDYQQLVEMNNPIRYAQIRVDGECLYDFFAKDTTARITKSTDEKAKTCVRA
jgi:hypothetical protein